MCNDGWNDKYASLVCAQMGLGSKGEVADFGAGSGSIFLEKVVCSLNDTVLASCGHYGVGVIVQCNHNDDVGLKCDGMYVVLRLYLVPQVIFNCDFITLIICLNTVSPHCTVQLKGNIVSA